MSTPFLTGFANALVVTLLERDLLEVQAEQGGRVVRYLADHLGTHARGGSLLSNVEAALLSCPEVEELYADIDSLKVVVEDLDH